MVILFGDHINVWDTAGISHHVLVNSRPKFRDLKLTLRAAATLAAIGKTDEEHREEKKKWKDFGPLILDCRQIRAAASAAWHKMKVADIDDIVVLQRELVLPTSTAPPQPSRFRPPTSTAHPPAQPLQARSTTRE